MESAYPIFVRDDCMLLVGRSDMILVYGPEAYFYFFPWNLYSDEENEYLNMLT